MKLLQQCGAALGVAVVLTSCTPSQQTAQPVKPDPAMRMFQNGYWLSYPDFFTEIDQLDHGNFTRFVASGEQATLTVTRESKKAWEKMQQEYLARDARKGPSVMLRNGSEATLLYSDLRANPDPNTQNCSFWYSYSIPQGIKQDTIVSVSYQAAQEGWQGTTPCTIYDEPTYSFHRRQIQRIIENYQPSMTEE